MFDGSRLKGQRELVNMSQERLAEKVDVHVNTIRRWEQNKQSPDVRKLEQLAEALDTSVAYLTGETGYTLQKGILQDTEVPDMPIKIRRENDSKEKRLIIQNSDMYVNLPETSEGFEILRRFFDMQTAKNLSRHVVPAI